MILTVSVTKTYSRRIIRRYFSRKEIIKTNPASIMIGSGEIMSNEFLIKIDGALQKYWKDILFPKVGELVLCELTVIIPDELLKSTLLESGLNSDIQIGLRLESQLSARARYFYKGSELEAKSNYILPENYITPNTLDILKECIKQDTHRPDIRHLESASNL